MAANKVKMVFDATPVAGVPVNAAVYDPDLSIWPGPGPILPPGSVWPGPGPLPPLNPGWPIGPIPPASARWAYTGPGADGTGGGWYFLFGPFDKPHPIGGNSNLDPLKTSWQVLMDGMGWTLVSGPYDKPFQIFQTPPPDPVDPPSQPPVSEGCRWTYTDAGWVLVCGPYEGGKPQPPHK